MTAIEIDFSSFWLSGSGRGLGFAVDEEPVSDAVGLPYLPGRHVKGVLREAARRLIGIRTDVTPERLDWLFGVGARATARDDRPGLGLLSVRDGRLSPALTAALARDSDARANLFRDIASTAIEDTGVARTASLRTIRVAVPLVLRAPIAFDASRAGIDADAVYLATAWSDIVADALVLATSFGAGRNKGFGRADARLVS